MTPTCNDAVGFPRARKSVLNGLGSSLHFIRQKIRISGSGIGFALA